MSQCYSSVMNSFIIGNIGSITFAHAIATCWCSFCVPFPDLS